jgi:hypothetical protein
MSSNYSYSERYDSDADDVEDNDQFTEDIIPEMVPLREGGGDPDVDDPDQEQLWDEADDVIDQDKDFDEVDENEDEEELENELGDADGFVEESEIVVHVGPNIETPLNKALKNVKETLNKNKPNSQKITERVGDDRKSKPILSPFEVTRLMMDRLTQLSRTDRGCLVVGIGIDSLSATEKAKMELKTGRMPFILKRVHPDGIFEKWRINEMENLDMLKL